MSSTAIPERQHTTWSNRAKCALVSYSSIFKGASWKHGSLVTDKSHTYDSFATENPQRYAYYALNSAVSLLVTGHEVEADQLFQITEIIADETLQNENFDIGDSIVGFYEENIAMARGKAMCLATRHNAHWYRTNEKNTNQLREAVDWYIEYLELIRETKNNLEDVMWRYIIAERFNDAIFWYHTRFRKALTTPINDIRYVSGMMHVLYFLAEYARGNTDILPTARAGVSHWYDFYVEVRNIQLDEDCNAWFYFWHHYICNQQDIRKILIGSRGYY